MKTAQRNGYKLTMVEKAILGLIVAIVALTVIDEVRGQEPPLFTAREADEIRDIVDEAILDIRYDSPLWQTSDHPESGSSSSPRSRGRSRSAWATGPGATARSWPWGIGS